MNKKVLKMALEALEDAQSFIEAELNDRKDLYQNYPNLVYKYASEQGSLYKNHEAVALIKNTLAQPEQKPFAWYAMEHGEADIEWNSQRPIYEGNWKPLYRTSPQRPWINLTDDELYCMYNEPRSDADIIAFAREVEVKLKEKNK